MIDVDPAFEHELFDMARAQGIRHIPADAGQNDFWREVGPLEAHRQALSQVLGCSRFEVKSSRR
jgi:hypothetical protein